MLNYSFFTNATNFKYPTVKISNKMYDSTVLNFSERCNTLCSTLCAALFSLDMSVKISITGVCVSDKFWTGIFSDILECLQKFNVSQKCCKTVNNGK